MPKNTYKPKRAASHKKTVHVMEKEASASESTDDELPLHILLLAGGGGSDSYCTNTLTGGQTSADGDRHRGSSVTSF